MTIRSTVLIAMTAALFGCAGGSLEVGGHGSTSAGGRGSTPAGEPVPNRASTGFHVFGGAVASCAALSCAQPDRIYRRAMSDPWSAPGRSGFELVEERGGVWLGHTEGERTHERGTTSFRSLGGWGTHTAFRIDVHVDTVTSGGVTEEFIHYELLSSGAGTGTNPVPPASGSATWSGAMAAVVTQPGSALHGSFVTGDATVTLTGLEVPIAVDVELGNIVRKRTGVAMEPIRWTNLTLVDGAFASPEVVPTVEPGDLDLTDNAIGRGVFGEFHGPRREEVGGVFIKDELRGAFAARRTE